MHKNHTLGNIKLSVDIDHFFKQLLINLVSCLPFYTFQSVLITDMASGFVVNLEFAE